MFIEIGNVSVCMSELVAIEIKGNNIHITLKDGRTIDRDWGSDIEGRNKCFKDAQKKLQEHKLSVTEKKPMKEQIKEYLNKHRDLIFTVCVVLLIDHFFLGGSLRERVKSLVNKLLDKTEATLKGV